MATEKQHRGLLTYFEALERTVPHPFDRDQIMYARLIWHYLCRMIPDTPTPTVCPGEDGDLCMSWSLEDRTVGASVILGGRIEWFGFFGGSYENFEAGHESGVLWGLVALKIREMLTRRVAA